MAIIHESKQNSMKEKASQYFFIAMLFFSIPIIYFISFTQGFYLYGIFHIFPFLLGGIGMIFLNKHSMLKAGIEGKEAAAHALRKLPDYYEVYEGIEVQRDSKTVRFDYVVVGDNGIFVVNVKNHNGTIEGREDASSWQQHKVGRKGGHYSNTIRNPIKRVRWQVHVLADYLKEKQISAWVEGIVYFANPSVRVNVNTERTPVIDSPEALQSYIDSYVPRKLLESHDLNTIRSIFIHDDRKHEEDKKELENTVYARKN